MREREKHGRAGWLLLLLLLALGAIWGQTSLRQAVGPQASLPTYGAASGLAAGPDYAWPKRLGADSEAVFAWRHYQKQLAEAAAEIKVGIYCTHSSESYTSFSGQAKVYGEQGGVYRAAAVLESSLNAEGIGTVVSETIHDWPDWNKSYANSLATAEGLLAAYPQLRVLIDLHRDAGVSREASVCEINGKKAARIMLVCGSAQRYDNDNWQKNEAFMQRLAAKMEELYPGLLRRVSVQAGRYNQHIFDHAILVEMGSTENHIDEVEYSASLLAEVLRQTLAEEAN